MGLSAFEHIAFRQEGGVAVVTILNPEVQADQVVEGLRSELHAAAEAFVCKKWVLDFHKVESFNTGALRPLLSLHRKIHPEGGRILLCSVKEPLCEVLRVTRMINGTGAPFELAKDIADALSYLKHHAAQLHDGVLVFTFTEAELHGDDLADDLGDEMQAALQQFATDRIVLDFARVTIITTPCMRPLLQLRTTIKKRGGRVAFSNLAPQVAEIFTVTRLVAPDAANPGLFETYPDNATAIRALR